MVNENQINSDKKALTHKATTLFIKAEHENSAPPSLYDLDLEFANTKKNKNTVIWISLVIFTLVFISAAYFVTTYIENQNSKIPIRIDAFEDVNLREIFDKAKQHEKEMKVALRDLEDIKKAKQQSLNTLRQIANDDIEIVETQNPADSRLRIDVIKIELDKKLIKEEEKWDIEIAKANERITIIQGKIDSYDTRILEKAKEQEGIINNQQKRFDIEMEKSVSYYEEKIEKMNLEHAQQIKTINFTNREIVETIRNNNRTQIENLENKYNPEFISSFDYFDQINKTDISLSSFTTRNINSIFYNENLLDKEKLRNQIIDIYRGKATYKRLKEIPYYNSTKEAIPYLENLYYQSIDEFTSLIGRLTPLLLNKNSTIYMQKRELNQLNFFLLSYVKANRVNGVIVDPRSKNIKVFIDPIYYIKEGSIGYVFRNDSDFLGTITFTYIDGKVSAQIDKLTNKERGIDPFDMILIDLN